MFEDQHMHLGINLRYHHPPAVIGMIGTIQY